MNAPPVTELVVRIKYSSEKSRWISSGTKKDIAIKLRKDLDSLKLPYPPADNIWTDESSHSVYFSWTTLKKPLQMIISNVVKNQESNFRLKEAKRLCCIESLSMSQETYHPRVPTTLPSHKSLSRQSTVESQTSSSMHSQSSTRSTPRPSQTPELVDKIEHRMPPPVAPRALRVSTGEPLPPTSSLLQLSESNRPAVKIKFGAVHPQSPAKSYVPPEPFGHPPTSSLPVEAERTSVDHESVSLKQPSISPPEAKRQKHRHPDHTGASPNANPNPGPSKLNPNANSNSTQISSLSREFWDNRRSMTALASKALVLEAKMRDLGAGEFLIGKDKGRQKYLYANSQDIKDRLAQVERMLEEERQRREQVELLVKSIQEECDNPVVVPALLSGFNINV